MVSRTSHLLLTVFIFHNPRIDMVAFSVLAFIGIFSPLVVTAQTVKQCRSTPSCPRDNDCTAILSNGAKFEMKCSTDYDTSKIIAVTQVWLHPSLLNPSVYP
jgi:hypothetical protein